MEIKIELNKGTKIYTIENCKIEEYFVENIYIRNTINIIESDFSHSVILNLEKYNDSINSFKTEKKLSYCFLTKEDLIKQL